MTRVKHKIDNLTVVIPFWRGNETLQDALDGIPPEIRVVIAKDAESPQPDFKRDNVTVIGLGARGYFAGACNVGIGATKTDVLILNQDAKLLPGWQTVINDNRDEFAVIGEGVFDHPAWPAGYIQGTFMFMRRDAIDKVGDFDSYLYPLWGATCEWQLRACRAGFKALPLPELPKLVHAQGRKERYGAAINQAINEEPDSEKIFLDTPPMISVIVPCYNYGRYLPDAINSLMRQTFTSFEVIIVDDASTDDSAEIAQSLADPFKGIRLIKNAVNVGAAAALNAGVAQSRGKYITVLSADDTYKPERLERLCEIALDNPHSVLYDDLVWSERGSETVRPMREYDFDELLNVNMMHAGIFYPREAWAKAGGYPEIMRDGREDWAFNIALGAVGYCGLHVPRAMYVYRRDGQNHSLTNGLSGFEYRLMTLFPDLYNGVKKVCNCGGIKSGARRSGVNNRRDLLLGRPGDDKLLVEYIGKNIGTEIWRIPNGRKMMFSKSPRSSQRWVTKTEAEYLLNSGAFRVLVGQKTEPHKFGEENAQLETA